MEGAWAGIAVREGRMNQVNKVRTIKMSDVFKVKSGDGVNKVKIMEPIDVSKDIYKG